MFPSWVIVFKLSKNLQFFQFCVDLRKKCKSIKAIYIYATERSRYALSEYDIVYYAMTYCFGDIWVRSRIILLHFCWVSILFDILIAHISWTVAQTSINHIIFLNRCSYVNYFNRLSFLLRSAQNFKKCTFLENLRTIIKEGNMETRQMTPFYSSTFSAVTVCNIQLCIWKLSNSITMWSLHWPILFCNIPQFCAKAADSDSPPYFSKK